MRPLTFAILAAVLAAPWAAGGFGTTAFQETAGTVIHAGSHPAGDVPKPVPASAVRPRLVVVLVVDQMRNDYIDEFGAHWTKGLRRLITEGARFRRAAYPYLDTVTCAGHATISTGAVPATHGIILNQWWHRDVQRELSCTDDPAAPSIGYGAVRPAPGHSARRLMAPALAQLMRAAQGGRSRVVTLSMKPRSAIMLAGGPADAVTWFDGRSFATSAAFASARVPFVTQALAARPIEDDSGRSWDRMLPPAAYKYVDAGEGEKPVTGWTRVFPHRLAGAAGAPAAAFYTQWAASPYADEYLERLAEAAVEGLRLGQGETTDYLGVSFSALDTVGHKFGPRSHEVQDLLARLDITIGRLLDRLDAKVGRGKYVVALTADHGVATIPEQLTREGIDAGRAIMDAAAARADTAVAAALGPGKYVARVDYTNLYFSPGVFERLTADAGHLEKVMQAIGQVRGVARVIDARTLGPGRLPPDPVLRAAALSEYRGRSGDLIVIPKMNWIWVAADGTATPGDATTHGTLYPYDSRVPLVLFGARVRPGQYDGQASPADIAPTLATMCGIALPAATGRALSEAITGP
jgi:predicted AlkP superfamily pyrophosphatase or phosphodiesterase